VTPSEYKTERQKRGTQHGVALTLGVDYRTIQRREAGDIPITEEARRAILSVPLRKKKRAPRRPNASRQESLADTDQQKTN
jgi:hypothetical protein